MKLLLIAALILLSISILLLSTGILLRRKGGFPNTHVGGQKALRDKGISCHTSQHREELERRKLSDRVHEL
ncbi:hypothetical protein [Porphyromonas sp. COT-239 OH1446]|uniref:hypothetical protein n=1 Tax=Porphyromonas sp. COT-239 OH1446 TaxID=1515613 RepID=UPI00052DE142|nr:hypothetical protein [Porphyromonas sp. COT-239 OH1446]KGN71305.1 hypothetical protein HQ37_02325 [Porphyromonas sp. COT-239 OH1446]